MRLGRVGQGHERENVMGMQQGVRERASWVDTDLSTGPKMAPTSNHNRLNWHEAAAQR